MDKTKYKKEYNKNKKRKLFKILFIIAVISFIIGIFYVAIISKSDKSLIKKTFDAYFLSIQNDSFNNIDSLIGNILTNVVLTFVVWILGISIIGIPVSVFYLIYRSFVTGFSISSLIYTYGFKGVIISIFYSFPLIINLLVFFILTFYAVNFSKKLYLYLFKKKDINLKGMTKVYTKVLIVFLIILLICSIVSSYLVPILLKSFTNFHI